ncbi:MAG: AMP-binding protein [Planctomycetales bacterium]|nr:AMP-binding protein [Planctomycetales bacterium]
MNHRLLDMTLDERSAPAERRVNVGLRLTEMAAIRPDDMAVAQPTGRGKDHKFQYRSLTFRELDEQTNRIAAGLAAMGIRPGDRLALLTPPSLDFISLVFAMFKAGVVTVMIDPGMGRSKLIHCLSRAECQGFVGVPLVHAIRTLLRWKFPAAKKNVTVGRKWWWGGKTLDQLRETPLEQYSPAETVAEDPAAIIFTTGSTGPPKGVLYRHGNFNQQVDEIRDRYEIQPGEIDLPGFPLFALFNAAMGVGTVIPPMDFTRPAKVDPEKFIEVARDWEVTQSFGSPALWNTVGRYCERRHERIPSLRRVLSAGAPVPPHVIRRVTAAIHAEGDIHTPYGATEALPVASISGREVLEETAAETMQGKGVCVGSPFPGIRWRVVEIDDGPLEDIAQTREVAQGEIGELMVQGGVVTTEYVVRSDCNPLHKVADGDSFWHRMGDVGYLDDSNRFWFCGRKAHRVRTAETTLFTIPCEAIFNEIHEVYRSALVGVGSTTQDARTPVIVVEPWPEHRPTTAAARADLIEKVLQCAAEHSLTRPIRKALVHLSMPVDIRHNSKIFREKLAVWAARQIK